MVTKCENQMKLYEYVLSLRRHAHAEDIHDYLNIHLKSDEYQIWTGAKRKGTLVKDVAQ